MNRADAAFCTQCFLPTESQPTIAPTPGGRMTSFTPAPAGPAAVSTWVAAAAPLPPPAISPRRAPGRILWRWPHLWMFGLCAWGVPSLLGRLATADTVSRTLDKTLVIQILGYFLASVMAVVLVNKVQAGDWGSLGIRRSVDTAGEVLRGLAFGTVLIGIWLPISLLLTKGRLATDPMVRALVGETSGPGLVLAAFVLVVGAPFIEEIYYRGMLYEKLRRRGRPLAIIVTSVLFVAAHGALIIPALMLLAFGLAWKRETKSIWYTMAAHGAWNFVVLCLGAFIVFSPAKTFSPPDGAYSLRHPARWERVSALESQGPHGVTVDAALASSDGSVVIVARIPWESHTPDARLGFWVRDVPGLPPGATVTNEQGRHSPVSGAPAFEVSVAVPEPYSGVTMDSRVVVVMPREVNVAFMFNVTCPQGSCAQAHDEFDKLLGSVHLAL